MKLITRPLATTGLLLALATTCAAPARAQFGAAATGGRCRSGGSRAER
ncbi:MAG: hypothetical protein QM775_31600 [Pirellulales bacterium]